MGEKEEHIHVTSDGGHLRYGAYTIPIKSIDTGALVKGPDYDEFCIKGPLVDTTQQLNAAFNMRLTPADVERMLQSLGGNVISDADLDALMGCLPEMPTQDEVIKALQDLEELDLDG